jgi:hypothetical protein
LDFDCLIGGAKCGRNDDNLREGEYCGASPVQHKKQQVR